jgi:peptide-methionine (R)-S-oxide reductase
MNLTDDEWRQKLSPEQYKVLREKGTEIPFSGEHLANNADGMFTCTACSNPLFSSDTKYESNIPGLAGWPSFSEVAKSDAVKLVDDNSMGMHRVEVVCANCNGHLGHVFDGDSDSPTGQHFCINSTCLAFKPKDTTGTQA